MHYGGTYTTYRLYVHVNFHDRKPYGVTRESPVNKDCYRVINTFLGPLLERTRTTHKIIRSNGRRVRRTSTGGLINAGNTGHPNPNVISNRSGRYADPRRNEQRTQNS